MATNIITQEDLEQFKAELLEDFKELLQSFSKENQEPPQNRWLKSHQVQRMLGISPGTLQNLRINGTIPFSKIGGVILYSNDEINKLINDNMRNIS